MKPLTTPDCITAVQGYYGYYGVTYNGKSLTNFAFEVRRILLNWLGRRGKRKCYNIEESLSVTSPANHSEFTVEEPCALMAQRGSVTEWIGYCGAGRKLAGNCENQLDPVVVRETGLLDRKIIIFHEGVGL